MEQQYEPHSPDVEQLSPTPRQQKNQDALGLAELIYDIFKYGLSSATMEESSIKDKQNV